MGSRLNGCDAWRTSALVWLAEAAQINSVATPSSSPHFAPSWAATHLPGRGGRGALHHGAVLGLSTLPHLSLPIANNMKAPYAQQQHSKVICTFTALSEVEKHIEGVS